MRLSVPTSCLLATGLAVALAGPAAAAAGTPAGGAPEGVLAVPATVSAVYRTPRPTGPGGRLLAAPSLTTVPGLPGVPRSRWEVTYTGFTPQAQASFQAAVDLWAGIVSSPVPIRVSATLRDLGNPDLLGRAGPTAFLTGPGIGDGHSAYPSALADAVTSRELRPGAADIVSEFNSGAADTYYGTDGHPAAWQTDFETVVLHELGHGLGFLGSLSYDPDSGLGYRGASFPYDGGVVGTSGRLADLPSGSTALGAQLVGGRLTWSGSATSAVTGGRLPRLYAPSTWRQGSSLSHLDEDAFPRGDGSSLMTPYLDGAEVVRDPGPVTRAILQDMGWAGATVPTTLARTPGRDLWAVRATGGGSGRVEVHGLAASTGYQGFLTHAATALGAVDPADWRFYVAPYAGSGRPDLVAVLLRHSGSGMVEVHVLSAASGYSAFSAHAATALRALPEGSPATVAVGSWGGDGQPDLHLVLPSGTGTGAVEVHVLSAASGWRAFVAHAATPLPTSGVDPAHWTFLVGGAGGSGDLVAVLHGGTTGSGRTEVHVLSSASGYRTFTLHAATPAGYTDDASSTWVAGDVDGDGVPDAVLVLTTATGTGTTELHALAGGRGFGAWSLHTGTGLALPSRTPWSLGLG